MLQIKQCTHCAFYKGDENDPCNYDVRTDGGEYKPFLVPAAMPNPTNGGANCIHYILSLKEHSQ